jgi:hypothetical protein
MRYLSSIISSAIVLSVLGPSLVFGQAGPPNTDVPRLEPRGISSVSIPPLGSNYIELSEVRNTRTQFYVTFQVILVNNGPALPGVTATVSTQAPSVQLVPGQNTVHFAPVPANSTVMSNDSFTILIDRSVPFDFSFLQWSFANPVANPGPNQTATVGSTVTLNGSGSTNPSGIGSLTYNWSFTSVPSGSTAALTNPNSMVATFVVDVPGTYNTKLTVSNGTLTDSATAIVSTVSTPPVANAGPNQSVTLGSTVRLDGSKSSDTDGNPLTYSWSLIGIPATSAATLSNGRSVNPTFVADVPGSYIAQLIVSDGTTNSQPSTVVVTTANTPPVANAGPNQRANVGSLVQLNGSGSTDVNGNPLTYQWSLNTTGAPGSRATLSNPNIVNPTFTMDVAGTYVAQLIVSDGVLSSQPATVSITSDSVQPPTANAGNNQTVVHGSTVTLNGTGSSDPQGLPLSFMWSLITKPANSHAVLTAINVPNPQFVADQPGTYIAQLVVYDGVAYSATPATVTITTTNTPPVANAGLNQALMVGATVTLDGSQSFDADNDPITYSWAFLNIPGSSVATLTGAKTKNPTFVADAAGTYVVQLIVSDPFTSSNPATVTITAGVMTISLSPSPLNLVNSPVPLTITLSPGAGANPVVVGLSGFNPNVISIPSPTVTVPANSSGVNVTVTPLTAGSTQIIANAGGYQPATDTVTVATASISVALNNNATAIGLTRTLSGTITLSSAAPQGGLSVALSSDPSALGQLSFDPPSVSIPQGAMSGTFTATGLAVGSTTITASASGYTSGTQSVLVVQLGGIAVSTGVTVAPGQSAPLGVQLSTPAPVGGVTVTLTSTNPGQLTVSPSVFIAQGSTIPATPAQVTGVAIGSPSVSASAGGYSGDSETVNVIATISLSPPTLTVGPGGTQTLNINLSSAAPSGGLPVTLMSSRPGAATVPQNVTINGTGGSVQVTGVAPGQTTITASSTNPLFSVVGTGVVVTVTTAPVLTCPAVSSGEVGVALNSPAMTVSGGTSPYTFSVVGTLPNGLTLNATNGAITGTPTASGTFTIQVKDANGVMAASACPFTINGDPVLTCPAVSSGEVGVALNSPAMTVSGGTSPYTFSVVGTLPNGLTLNTTTGAITGTPTASGTFSIQVKDANGVAATGTCPFTINGGPVLTCPAVSSGEVGVALNSPAMTVGGGTSPYTFSVVGALPNGLTLNTATGAITGTPTASGSFNIQVKDANGVVAASNCPFTISNGPVLTCPAVSSGEVGVALNSPAMTVSGGTSPYTFSVIGTLPNGLTLNTTTGAITGTPTASGTFSIQVKDASGAVSITTCPFTIAGGPVLTCPAVSSGEVGVALNSPAMTVGGGTAPYTFSVVGTLPNGLTLNTTTGAITGTPTTSGTFTIQVKDANGVVAAGACPFTIVSGPTLTCPAVSSGEVGVALNSPAMTVSGGTSPYTFSVVGTLPNGLTLNTGTGAITGTPTAAGTFSIQVKDANGVTSATVCPFTIAAAPTLTCPAISSGEVGAALNSPAITVSGGTSPYTFSVVGTLPNGLTLNTTTGAITGTPTVSGTFTIQVKDSKGVAASSNCPFTINGGPILTCPVVSSGEVGVALNSPAMTVSGGTSPYTFSVVGTLPNGLTLSTTTGALTGTPTASGTFSIQVKDASGITATACPFTIDGGPVLTCPAVNSGEVGVALNSPAMTVSGGTSPYTFSVLGTLPNGLTLNTSTGAITGTPTASGNFTIQVKDANGVVAASTCPFTIASAPTLTCPAISAGEVGVALNSPAMTVSGGTSPYTFSVVGTLPNGLTLNATTGAITGTPTASGTFTIQVKDAKGAAAVATCPFTIAGGPSLTCPAVSSGEVGVALNSPAMTVSGGTSPYTFSVVGTLPNGLTLNATTGAITGTPTASGTFIIQVKDANGVTSATTCPFTIATAPVLTCPAVSSGEVGVALNSLAMTVSGGTAPYTFSVSGTLPNGLTLNTTTGAITGTPTASGTFTIQVKDAKGVAASSTCPFTIAGAPVLTCPAISSGEVGVALNSPAMTVSGGTSPYTFSVSGTLPNGLTLNTTTGAITGTPTASGSFSILVKDSKGVAASSSCPFTISGGPMLTCPAVSSGEVGVALNSPAMTVSGGTSPYTFSVVGTLPNGLTLNTTTGAITGTPTASGTFTIQVKDASGVTSATTCPFTIATAPVLTCPAISSGEVGVALNSLAMTVSGGTSPYTFSVVGALPNGLTLNTTTGAITGTPTASGTFSIQVKDAKGVAAPSTCPFTIATAPVLTCPAISSGEVGVALNSPAMTVSGGTSPYTFSVVGTLPNGLTLNTTTGAITGTPTASGTFSIQMKDANGVAATSQCPFTINGGPVLTCPAVSSGEVGVALNSPAMTVSGGTSPYTFSVVGTLPGGLTLNTTTGAITGTPTASGTFSIQVKDASGVTSSTTCPFMIAAAPTLTCPAVSSGEVGVALNSPAPTVGGGTAPYTFSVTGTLPNGLTLNTTTGAITGTPTAPGTFTLQVKDSKGASAVTTCPFTIVSPPALTCSAVSSGEVGVALNSPGPTVNGGTAPYTFSLATGTLPHGLTMSATTGAISGTPTASGTFTLQVKDANGIVATGTCPFTIVTGPSLTCPANSSFTKGSPVTSPAMSVSGGVSPYTFSVVGTLPAGLTVSTATGAITGTPTANGTFTIQVKDANGVVGVPTCPFTVGANTLAITTTSLPAGAPAVGYSFQPLTSGGTQPFTWTISGLPRGITGNSSSGLISGTTTFSGTYNVTISVTDSSSTPQTASTTLALVIFTPPLSIATPAALTNALVGIPYSVQITAAGGQVPYNWSANTTATTFPSWLTFDLSGRGVSNGGCDTPVTLCGTPPALGNFTFQVTVIDSSNPAQSVTQTFTGTVTPPGGLGAIAISNATVGRGLEVPISITFTPVPTVGAVKCDDGPASSGCVTLTSSNPSLILIGGAGNPGSASLTAPIAAGTSTFQVFAQAVGTAAAGTTITITASFAGYSNGIATITYANSGFVVSGPNGIGGAFSTFQGVQTGLTVFAARLDSSGLFVEPEDVVAGSTLSVPIASSSPTIGAVSPTLLSFSGGTSSAAVNFTASGASTGNTTVTLTQPAGFTTPVVGGTLSATVKQSGLIAPSGLIVGKNLQVSTNVSLNGNASQTVSVTLQSTDSTRLQFACPPQGASPVCTPSNGASSASITVKIPQNSSQSANFFVRAYDSAGSVGYTISAPNFGMVSATMPLAPSGFVIQTPGGGFGSFSMTLNSLDATLNVFTAAFPGSGFVLESVAGDKSVSATVASDTPGVGTIGTSPVVIAGGDSSGSTTFHAVSVGSANITASATGYTSATVKATVQSNTLAISNFLTVGQHLEAQANVFLSTAAPAGGLPVTLSVDAASMGRMQLAVNATDAGSNTITVTVPQGQSIGTYWIYAQESSGTATYTATAPGYGSGGDTVFMAPSGVIIVGPGGQPGSTSVSLTGGPQTLTVITDQLTTDGQNTPQPGAIQALAGNVTLSVMLGDSNRGPGSLSAASVNIAPGTSMGTVTFTPQATGIATISVVEPAGWTMPGLYAGSFDLTLFTFQVQ